MIYPCHPLALTWIFAWSTIITRLNWASVSEKRSKPNFSFTICDPQDINYQINSANVLAADSCRIRISPQKFEKRFLIDFLLFQTDVSNITSGCNCKAVKNVVSVSHEYFESPYGSASLKIWTVSKETTPGFLPESSSVVFINICVVRDYPDHHSENSTNPTNQWHTDQDPKVEVQSTNNEPNLENYILQLKTSQTIPISWPSRRN